MSVPFRVSMILICNVSLYAIFRETKNIRIVIYTIFFKSIRMQTENDFSR